MKKLLLVFPHPDDESFACGGTAAKYVAAGWEAHFVCATQGEPGKTPGLSSITHLGYKDGTLSKIHPGELEDKIFREMARLVPNIVITFEPRGVTNHPDHIKLTIATTVAFQRYVLDVADMPQFADLSGARKRKLGYTYKESFEDCLALEQAPRLYYACLPESAVSYLQKRNLIASFSFGKPWLGTPDKLVTTVIDIKWLRSKKIQAIGGEFFPITTALTHEYFILRLSGYNEVFMGKNDRVSNRL